MRLAPLLLVLFVADRGARLGSACDAPSPGMASAFAVVERRAPSDTLATITICLVSDPSRLRVAGYHGELALSRTSRVIKVDRPAGGTRIENATVPGRVSFAGVASNGLAPGPLLGLVIAQRRGSDDERIRLTMIDVTDVDGRSVGQQVRVDSMPRFTRQP